MFDTLTFSQKMQNAGMDSKLADELAFSLRDMNKSHFDILLTRDEFKKSEEKIHNDFKEFKQEMQSDFREFKEEMQSDFREFKEEMQSSFKIFKEEIRIEFGNKLKNLELSITVRMGIMMATGISIIGLMIKM